MLLSPTGSNASLPSQGFWARLKTPKGGKEMDIKQVPPSMALARQRLLTLAFGEMETIRMLPPTFVELEATARDWIKPPPGAEFSMRVPVEYASIQAARLVSGPYIYLTSEDSYQIATVNVQGLRVEIVADAPPPPDEPPPPPPPPVTEMPGTFNLELNPGQMIALDTMISSDDMDMARLDDGTMVDGQFWGKLNIVHSGDTHEVEFTGTRIVGDIPPDLLIDHNVIGKLAQASKPALAKCNLHILAPSTQYCDITLTFSPFWKMGLCWPIPEETEQNKAKYYTRVYAGGAIEHFDSMTVSTALYYEAILASPDPGMLDPQELLNPQNSFALPYRDFVPHIAGVMDQLGLSMQSRSNFLCNYLSAFAQHKNIAYRFLSPSRICKAIDISVSTAENGAIALDLVLGHAHSLRTTPREEVGSVGLDASSGSAVASTSAAEVTGTHPSAEGHEQGPESHGHGQEQHNVQEEHKYAVVFLDNQMPVLSGLDAVAKLREMGRTDFVVGVTGNALLGDQQEYLGKGADQACDEQESHHAFYNDVLSLGRMIAQMMVLSELVTRMRVTYGSGYCAYVLPSTLLMRINAILRPYIAHTSPLPRPIFPARVRYRIKKNYVISGGKRKSGGSGQLLAAAASSTKCFALTTTSFIIFPHFRRLLEHEKGLTEGPEQEMQNGYPQNTHREIVTDIKNAAKEQAQRVRGASAMSLLRTAREQILNASDKESEGDLRGALSAYTKAACLTQMFMETAEFRQEMQPGKKGVLTQDLMKFQQNESIRMKEGMQRVEGKLAELNRAAATREAESEDADGAVLKGGGGSIADRLRALQSAGLSTTVTSKRISRELHTTTSPPASAAAPISPEMHKTHAHKLSLQSLPSPMAPSTSTSSHGHGSPVASSSTSPSPPTLVPVSSFGPPSPTSSTSSSPRIPNLNINDFNHNFPSIDELDEMEGLKISLPTVPSAPVKSTMTGSSKHSYNSGRSPVRHYQQETQSPVTPVKPFPALPMDIAPRPSSTPIPTVDAFISRPASPSLSRSPMSPTVPKKPSNLSLNAGARSPLIPQITPEKRELPTAFFPHTLHEFLQENPSVLILDVRPRAQFELGHIKANAVVCIEPSILFREKVSSESIEDALVLAPRTEQNMFSSRDKFDVVVLCDEGSQSIGESAALKSLMRAIYELAFKKILRNMPVILVGGMKAWEEELGLEEMLLQDCRLPY
ncbi:hypothetical protein NM688_g4923 [Phlebia brevispora]|uniref:Uncharacterized protein n=1 Tax=Phlebia brevispora TaxID=194682 RepID=A0ACC1T1A2_9APHY|nr:hypothetical protein NM688_g4923 [Phlebia brevispora]